MDYSETVIAPEKAGAFDKALGTLEFYKILDMLSECAPTEGSKERAENLRPEKDPVRIKKLLDQTTDAKKLASIKGMPGFGGVKNVIAAAERADKGAVLSTRELLDVANLLNITRRLLDYINTDKRFETSLDEIFDRLQPNRNLEERITRTIIAEDMIADEASPALSDIRRKMRGASNRVKDSLQKYVGGSYAKYLQDNLVTMRNGRYVIPVKSEYKNEIKGLIHDTSSSGATVFIEPLTVVEANNELRELESKEKHEIERILAELSSLCSDSSGVLTLDYYNITELAFIFAKSELSYRMNAAAPALNTDTKKRFVELRRARHPLLNPAKVVPINITLGGEFDTLVITGPNTGGKTVTLKTIGLLALMAQAGLHIPADDTSSVCVFDDVLADIGDEQSIEQSLSTFSAHMVNIVDIMARADENSLALFDELGAGTDPVEGAALAESILETIREKHLLCAATTHYAELKAYALETAGVSNASCEFDIETLRPTYRLIIGTPGKSNAFAISEKLGLDPSVIERAKAHVSSDSKKFEYVIEKLEQSRIEMEAQRDEMARLKREYEGFKEKSERDIRQKTASAEKEIEKNRALAQQMLSGAKVSSDYIFEQLDAVKKQRDSENFNESLEEARRNVRKSLRETEDKVNPVSERANEDYKPSRPLKKGDEVVLVNIGKRGILTSDPDKDGSATVRAGIINTKTNVKNLMLAEDSDQSFFTNAEKKKTPVSDYKVTVSRNFKPEIDLRGMNGEDAWFMVDRYIDEAKIAGIHSVRLIHGKGTGALKTSLWKDLKSDARVASYRLGSYGEGDLGVTIVEVK